MPQIPNQNASISVTPGLEPDLSLRIKQLEREARVAHESLLFAKAALQTCLTVFCANSRQQRFDESLVKSALRGIENPAELTQGEKAGLLAVATRESKSVCERALAQTNGNASDAVPVVHAEVYFRVMKNTGLLGLDD